MHYAFKKKPSGIRTEGCVQFQCFNWTATVEQFQILQLHAGCVFIFGRDISYLIAQRHLAVELSTSYVAYDQAVLFKKKEKKHLFVQNNNELNRNRLMNKNRKQNFKRYIVYYYWIFVVKKETLLNSIYSFEGTLIKKSYWITSFILHTIWQTK
jgi:hypothetical protein